MDLEVDLGVDSIKRVQILTRLREHFPGEADVDPAELARLRTIAEIADKLAALRGPAASTPAPASPAPADPAPSPIDGEQVALSIVAELTGYPVEMLTADMDLEVDLGVDSIKRVQILTRLREHFPGEADVDPAELARLRTIAEIADKLAALRTPAHTAPATAPHDAAPAVPRTAVLRTGLTPVSVEPAAGGPVTGLRQRPLLITDDGNGVAECLAETLRREGIKSSIVDRVPAGSSAVISLDGLRAIDPDTDPDAPTRAVFTTLVAVADAMRRDNGVLVTVQDTGGDFGTSGAPERVGCAGIAALARTASNEWAGATVKTIDIERGARAPQDIAQDIANEILLGGDTTDVALSADGRRSVLRGAPETTGPRVPLDLGPNPVVVVTGGARGITAACVRALALAHRPRLVLLGRTRPVDEDDALRGAADEAAIRQVLSSRPDSRTGALPSLGELAAASKCVLASREIRATLDHLAEAGAETRYVVADATDRERMAEVLAEVRRDWGPITGIIHAAGVLADHNIADKTPEQFDIVYGTKVGGLRTLLALTQDDPLRLVCLFSSVSARLGTAGQSDYAAANQALEHIAQAEASRTPDRVVKAIAWGPWAAGMVSTAHAEHFRRLGVPLLDEADGVRAFMAELEQPGTACLSIAAGTSDAVAEQTAVTDILVGADTHPYLADHSIAGRPVVPVALVVEWFTRAARAAFPAQASVLIRDVRVLRAIALDKFGLEQTRLQLHVRPSGAEAGGPLRLELKGLDGSLHYTAVADHADVAALPGAPELPEAGLAERPSEPTYDGVVLFHGPLFRAIRAIDGLGSVGARTDLVGLKELHWPKDAWLTDPAVVDGALQTACLWVASSAGVPSLPMGVREVRALGTGPVEGPVRCTVRGLVQGTDNATCDIWLGTEQGGTERVFAVLSGVEMVYRPDASGGRRHNALTATDA
ncbi:SDR family NAD(P)-dependent oxidoreductase [Yinghuangia sp. ASG 101]|nr:SDR family NAD(P)-dependent oxidoreductase [Yinghuangia sp. ASG 101]